MLAETVKYQILLHLIFSKIVLFLLRVSCLSVPHGDFSRLGDGIPQYTSDFVCVVIPSTDVDHALDFWRGKTCLLSCLFNLISLGCT